MKIIATISSYLAQDELCDIAGNLIKNEITNCRFNMAKISNKKEDMDEALTKLNKIKQLYPSMNIILDIPYPGQKLRLNIENKCIEVKKGMEFLLKFSEKDKEMFCNEVIVINGRYDPEIFAIGKTVFYDMGQGCFTILEYMGKDTLKVLAQNDFLLYNKKSVSCGSIIKKEYKHYLRYIFDIIKVDSIAFSFVEKGEELEVAKFFQDKYKYQIVSKIESYKGIEHLDKIIEKSDAIMLGRGDLGLYADCTRLMEYQQNVCRVCKMRKKKVYFATGYLESLKQGIIPTRSEIIDLGYSISLKPDGLVLNAAIVESSNLGTALQFIKRVAER